MTIRDEELPGFKEMTDTIIKAKKELAVQYLVFVGL